MKTITNPSFGLYHFDHDYVNSLRHNSPEIFSPDQTDTYCGPVCTTALNNAECMFFVPVLPNAVIKNKTDADFYAPGVYGGVLDMQRMILFPADKPCPVSEFSSDTHFEYQLDVFCSKNREEIEEIATNIIRRTIEQ